MPLDHLLGPRNRPRTSRNVLKTSSERDLTPPAFIRPMSKKPMPSSFAMTSMKRVLPSIVVLFKVLMAFSASSRPSGSTET